MSKGSKIVQVRVGAALLCRIQRAIADANLNRRDMPYVTSDWIRKAICEKLAHLERSKRKKTQLVRPKLTESELNRPICEFDLDAI